ncbi:hypothetical protein [Solibacillus sp. FSL H8-0538]|uniref:hypothetical protein n=1 Tax=Solibacillus sp. FSL H8-0538 TaxID=2921400 RepID=UPI0030FC43B8
MFSRLISLTFLHQQNNTFLTESLQEVEKFLGLTEQPVQKNKALTAKIEEILIPLKKDIAPTISGKHIEQAPYIARKPTLAKDAAKKTLPFFGKLFYSAQIEME